MTLPNFLIIGATKAGTTSLYDYLRQHPDVFMPSRIKEPRFFCYEGRDTSFTVPIKTREQYEALFAEATGATAVGEATPHYLVFQNAAREIHKAIPQTRIIASLRDPVERSYSTYQMNLRNMGRNEGVPYVKAIETDRWLTEKYHDNLLRFYDLFDRDRIAVVLFDDLVSQTAQVVRSLLTFLKVDPEVPLDVSKTSNPGGLPRNRMLHNLLHDGRVRAFGRRLLPMQAIESARRLRSANLVKQTLSSEDRAVAIEIFRDDILRTQDLIERDLSHWLRV